MTLSASRARLRAITAVDQLHGYAFVVLAFEIGRRLGLSLTALAAVAVVHGAGFAVVGRAVASRARRGRASAIARGGAIARAGALAVGAFPAAAPVAVGLAAHGAARSSVPGAHPLLLGDEDREAHRLVGRLGNVAAPLLVGALALVLSWPAVFVVLAAVSAIPVMRLRSNGREDNHPIDLADDDVVARFLNVPGARVVLNVIAMAALTEFPVHVLAFGHLGAIGVPVWVRAGVAAGGELIGVLANLAIGDRLTRGSPRSPQTLAIATLLSVTAGLALLVVSVSASSPAVAVAALAVGAVGISAVIPFLALATRAVLEGAVPPIPVLAAGGAIAIVVATASAATTAVVWLSALPIVATLATGTLAFRSPEQIAGVLDGVANVTPGTRISPAPVVLDQA